MSEKQKKEDDKNADKDTRIPLSKAMGSEPSDSTLEFSRKWITWSTTYPTEKETISPAVTITLDSMAATVTVYDTVVAVIAGVQAAVKVAKEAYDAAMMAVPGVGSANAAKMAADKALEALKKQIADLAKKIAQMPPNVWNQMTNINVDAKATITPPPTITEDTPIIQQSTPEERVDVAIAGAESEKTLT